MQVPMVRFLQKNDEYTVGKPFAQSFYSKIFHAKNRYENPVMYPSKKTQANYCEIKSRILLITQKLKKLMFPMTEKFDKAFELAFIE
uniref:Uncharacterized protein n=1 Tax=Romanomermis culicivorax TaxID=13658 RepID=A0A915L8E1_ROMCU